MTFGTSHFVSKAAAVRHYRPYEGADALAAVNRKLKEGAIQIGKPKLKPGERLFVIDGGTRYAIEEGRGNPRRKRNGRPYVQKGVVPARYWEPKTGDVIYLSGKKTTLGRRDVDGLFNLRPSVDGTTAMSAGNIKQAARVAEKANPMRRNAGSGSNNSPTRTRTATSTKATTTGNKTGTSTGGAVSGGGGNITVNVKRNPPSGWIPASAVRIERLKGGGVKVHVRKRR